MARDQTMIASLAAWPEHRRVLAQAMEHFQNDARVPGLLLGGSFASGAPDFYSDLDLYIIVHDEHFADVLAEKTTAAAAAGRTLTGFVPDHLGPGGDEMYIAVYDGPVKVDFNYVRRSTIKPNWKLARRLVLKDTDRSVAGAIRASVDLAPPPPSQQELDALHNKFLTWCWYVFGKIARGELWEALDGVHTIRSLALVPIAEWDANRPPEGHRRLESRLDDHVRARLAATVSTLDRTALYGALQAEIHLFRELQARVWTRYGAPVNETAGRQIEEAIRRSWAGTRGASARSLEPRGAGMTSDDSATNRALLQQILRIFETGNVPDVQALIDVNYIDHQGLGGAKLTGLAGFRQVVAAARAATPSLQVAIQDLVTEGDRVVARLRWYASVSGQPYERETIDILRIVDGRLVEHWGAVADGPQEAGRGPTAAAAGTTDRLRNPDGVRAAYDAWAATYDDDRNLTPFTTTIIRSQSLRLSGACVVEIGCGTGANTVWLAEAADRVIAFDFSERMLDQARRRATSNRVHFFRHDVSEPWPIPDESADVVLDSLVLEHIADLRAVFRETHRVLKPGGSAFVFELHPFNQMAGGQAHFVDRSTGKEVWVPAVRHDVSDYVNSGLAEGLCLTTLGEWRGSNPRSDTPPILLSLAFQKPAPPRAHGPGKG